MFSGVLTPHVFQGNCRGRGTPDLSSPRPQIGCLLRWNVFPSRGATYCKSAQPFDLEQVCARCEAYESRQLARRAGGAVMPEQVCQSVSGLGTDLRYWFAPSVWERRLAIFFLCTLFFLVQSAPVLSSLGSADASFWARVCTGAGIEFVQLGDDGQEAPPSAAADCTCCLPARYDSLLVPPDPRFVIEARKEMPVFYASVAPGPATRGFSRSVSCRGPPAGVNGMFLLRPRTCSDPPGLCIGLANSVSAGVWT